MTKTNSGTDDSLGSVLALRVADYNGRL